VLTVQVGSRLVGVAAFERLTGDTAEVALLVADDYHERGIGTQLLEHLAQVARNNGIRRFQADLLGENDPALRMVRDLGWAAQMRFHDGIGRVVADLAPDTAVVRLPLMASSWMKTEIGGVVGGVHRCRTGGCGTGGRDGGVDRGPGAIGGGGVVDATGGRGRRGGGRYEDSDQRGSRCIRRVSWRSTSTTWRPRHRRWRIDLPRTCRTWIGRRRCGSWRSLIARYHAAGGPVDDHQ